MREFLCMSSFNAVPRTFCRKALHQERRGKNPADKKGVGVGVAKPVTSPSITTDDSPLHC